MPWKGSSLTERLTLPRAQRLLRASTIRHNKQHKTETLKTNRTNYGCAYLPTRTQREDHPIFSACFSLLHSDAMEQSYLGADEDLIVSEETPRASVLGPQKDCITCFRGMRASMYFWPVTTTDLWSSCEEVSCKSSILLSCGIGEACSFLGHSGQYVAQSGTAAAILMSLQNPGATGSMRTRCISAVAANKTFIQTEA